MGRCLGKYEGDQTFAIFTVYCPGLHSAGRWPGTTLPNSKTPNFPVFPLPLFQMEDNLLDGDYAGGGVYV